MFVFTASLARMGCAHMWWGSGLETEVGQVEGVGKASRKGL